MSDTAYSVQSKCPQCGGTGMVITSSGQDGQEIPCNWPGCENGWVSCGQVILPVNIVTVLTQLRDKLDEIEAKIDAL